MKSIFGGLLEFKNKEHLNAFLTVIDKNDAITLIEKALLYSQQNGLYTFEESHVIYKSINKLKENEENHIPDNVPDGNSNRSTHQ